MLDYLSLLCYGIPLLYIVTKVTSYFATYFSTWAEAKRFAASSPIPSISIPTQRSSAIFWLVSPYLAPFIRSLPFGWGYWITFLEKDAAWHFKGDLHRNELGSDLYWTAGPGGLCLYVSDPDVISQMAHRWKDFSKQVEHYRVLALYGDNVVTAEGSTWQRHRKITGPPFNERNSTQVKRLPSVTRTYVSRLVFQETLAQGRAMIDSFTRDAHGNESSAGTEPVVDDLGHWIMTATLHVLSNAAFSLKMKWPVRSVAAPNSQQETPNFASTDHKMSFSYSVDFVMTYLQYLIIFPAWLLRNSPIALMRKMQACSDEFNSYMRELITDNQKEIAAAKDIDNNHQSIHVSTGKGDLLGNIVRASLADKKSALSDEETIGNIFIFIVAGHETTANTLQTALILLATEPELQQTVQKEIDSIKQSKQPGEDFSYDDYPKMRVTMSLMLETLRCFPPIVSIPKHCRETQTVIYQNQTIYLPANTDIGLDVVSVQRHPKYWGEDYQQFRPSRWIMPTDYIPPSNSSDESPAHTNLFCPTKGAFLAFSAGFRGCLGKKFAQVEFCTLIAVLLEDHTVELVRENTEEWPEARSKALGKLDDRRTGITMRMKKKVKVRFVKRGVETFPRRD